MRLSLWEVFFFFCTCSMPNLDLILSGYLIRFRKLILMYLCMQ